MAATSPQKVLRLGVIQNDRVVEERLFRTRVPITVGQRFRNEVVLPSADAPDTFTLFAVREGAYVLRFSRGMQGRVLTGSASATLDELAKSGKAKTVNGVHEVVLPDTSRGKLELGDTTLLFQFVSPPPLRVLPQLPADMRGSFLLFIASVIGLNGPFLASLGFSLVFQLGMGLYLFYFVPPPPRASELSVPDRFVRTLAVEEPPPPEETEPDDGEGPGEAEPTAEREPEPRPAAPEPSPAQEPRDAPGPAEQAAVAQMVQDRLSDIQTSLTTVRERSQQTAASLQQQLRDRTGGDGVVSSGEFGRGRGGGTGPSSIEVGDEARADVDVGRAREREERRVAGPPPGEIGIRPPVTAGSGAYSDRELSAAIRQRQREFQRCYQVALNENPTLAGRIVLTIPVDAQGNVGRVRLRDNTVGDQVGNCVVGVASRIRFDRPPQGGALTLTYPLTFRPGS